MKELEIEEPLAIDREIDAIIEAITKVLPIPLLLIAIVSFLVNDPMRGYVCLTAILPSLVTLPILRAGYPKLAIIYLALLITALNTVVCIMGMGIHDIAVVVFPVIVLFTSLILDIKHLIYVFGLIFLAMALIIMGEFWGWFTTIPARPGQWSDSILISVICAVALYITYLLSQNINKATQRSEEELNKRKEAKAELMILVDKKTELLKLVHHRVKNNLSFVSSLIDIEANDNEKNVENLRNIQNKIISIARSNDSLFQTDQYQFVNLRPYLEELMKSSFPLGKISFNESSTMISVKNAVPIGVIVQQFVLILRKHQDGPIKIKMREANGNLELELRSHFSNIKDTYENMLLEKSLVDIMTNEIKGSLHVDQRKLLLVIPKLDK